MKHHAVDGLDTGAELSKDDLTFFIDTGFRRLLHAMLKQSLKDIVTTRSDARASAQLSASVRWPDSPAGRDLIHFLLPGISTAVAVAKIYAEPEKVLEGMKGHEVEPSLPSSKAVIFSVGTDASQSDMVESALTASELCSDDIEHPDRPEHFDQFDYADSVQAPRWA